MSYTHLTPFERSRLETLSNLGFSTRHIAKQLHRHHSTIARELKRHCLPSYQAEIAQRSYHHRRLHVGPKGKKASVHITKIEDLLASTWSPEQIANTVLKGQISFKTIYRWLYDGTLLQGDVTSLRQKGKRRKPRETRGRFSIGTSIHKRPKGVTKRELFGHWEPDTMVSSRGKSKGCFATFVERKSRFYWALVIPDRSVSSMKEAILKLDSLFLKGTFQSYTVDRGKEFACYQEIERELGRPVYFADAYSSWQRGSNENSNGLLREFFPKKTDLANISQEELNMALYQINSRPRKCLQWKTAFAAFYKELSHLA